MPHAQRTIVIARPPAEVYAFFADAENDKSWRPGVAVIHREGPLAVGTRVTQRIAGPVAASCPQTSRSPRSTPTRAWPFAGWPARSALKVITPSLRPRAAHP